MVALLFRVVFVGVVATILFVPKAHCQTDQPEEETGDGYTLSDYEEPTPGNHRFWSLEFGPSFPTGSSERFYIPTNIIGVNPPEPYSNYYREGYSVNLATGVMTELGFEAALAFRITKINFTNRASALIVSDPANSLIERTYSSYLLGTQIYLGQRMKPLAEREESLFFGVAVELGALKHYSERFSTPEEGTFALSVIAGDEIPLQRDPEDLSMIALRVQLEVVALASEERPRFFHLTFGVRGYSP